MSGKNQKNLVVEKYAKNREEELISAYILKGPGELKKSLNVSDEEFKIIFDYLVFEHGLILRCFMNSMDFFTEIYMKYGAEHVRSVLDIEAEKYNVIFAPILDVMLKSVCREIFSRQNKDHSLKVFCLIYNTERKHRQIWDFGIL